MLKFAPMGRGQKDVSVATRSAVPSLTGTVLGFHMLALVHCLAPELGLPSHVHVAARSGLVAKPSAIPITPPMAATSLRRHLPCLLLMKSSPSLNNHGGQCDKSPFVR